MVGPNADFAVLTALKNLIKLPRRAYRSYLHMRSYQINLPIGYTEFELQRLASAAEAIQNIGSQIILEALGVLLNTSGNFAFLNMQLRFCDTFARLVQNAYDLKKRPAQIIATAPHRGILLR